MSKISQSCAVHYGETGAIVYLKKRVATVLKDVFPPSSAASFDYKAIFDTENMVLTIKKDEDVPVVVASLPECVMSVEEVIEQ